MIFDIKIKVHRRYSWFDVEYGIYFTTETGFYIFILVRGTGENISKSCLTSEINSIFNVNHWIFCLLHFLWFSNMYLPNLRQCMQYMIWRHNSLLFSQCENNTLWYFHSVIITACERYHFHSGLNPEFHCWKFNKNKYFRLSVMT